MTENRDEMWLRQPVSEKELEKAMEFIQTRVTTGQKVEEAISWASIRFGINVVKLRHETKVRGIYAVPEV